MVNGRLLRHHHTDDIENDGRPHNLWVTLDAVVTGPISFDRAPSGIGSKRTLENSRSMSASGH
jgi:hypothetical protein